MTGRYPHDFAFPEGNARVVPVRAAWWIHLFPVVDDVFGYFYAWLVDGFPVWINGRVHRQVEWHELAEYEDATAYVHRDDGPAPLTWHQI